MFRGKVLPVVCDAVGGSKVNLIGPEGVVGGIAGGDGGGWVTCISADGCGIAACEAGAAAGGF